MAVVAAARVAEDCRGWTWEQRAMKDHGDLNHSGGDGDARCGQTLAAGLYLTLGWGPKQGTLSSRRICC